MFNPGGEGEIRTLEPFLAVTRFPVVRARPTTRFLHVFNLCRFLTALLSYHNKLCLSRTFFKKVEIMKCAVTCYIKSVLLNNSYQTLLIKLIVLIDSFLYYLSFLHET